MNKVTFQTIMRSALIADAHAMPLQWNYEEKNIAEKLDNNIINLNGYNSGEYNNYFKGKKPGEQTHHGDQIIHLLEYITNTPRFSINNYKFAWRDYISEYPWHIDSSSKKSIEHISFNLSPSGADSSDFCGAIMGLPLLSLALDDNNEAITLMHSRVVMTHNNTLTLDTSTWICNTLFYITEGYSIKNAMDTSAKEINNTVFKTIYEKGVSLSSSSINLATLIKEIGLGCGIEVGLPVLVILMNRHSNNFEDFIINNTSAGADASPRALIGGAFIGASSSIKIPEQFVSQLAYKI